MDDWIRWEFLPPKTITKSEDSVANWTDKMWPNQNLDKNYQHSSLLGFFVINYFLVLLLQTYIIKNTITTTIQHKTKPSGDHTTATHHAVGAPCNIYRHKDP